MDPLTDQEALRLGRALERLCQNASPGSVIALEIGLRQVDVVRHPDGQFMRSCQIADLARFLDQHCDALAQRAPLRTNPFDGMDDRATQKNVFHTPNLIYEQ